MKYQEVWEYVRELRPSHNMLRGEGKLLFRLAGESKGPVIEVGSCTGRSTTTMACAVHEIIYAIDPHHGTMNGLAPRDKRPRWDTFTMLQANLEGADVRDRVVIIRKLSFDAVDDTPASGVGLLYLDGGHTYENTRRSLELFWPKVDVGGVVAFHDFAGGVWEELFQLRDELIASPAFTPADPHTIQRIFWGYKAQEELVL